MKQFLLMALLAAGCNAGQNVEPELVPPPASGFNILFIGNSLTYWNTMPAMVVALADSARQEKLTWGMVALPDFNLEDHWAEGSALRAIKLGNWDYVVLQQGPSSVEANRAQLIASTTQFNAEIRKVGATAGLYSVWPQLNRQQDFERASESYRMAAQAVGGLFLPVADAWRIALGRDNALQLYSGDGLHPTIAGSYLAALVIYAQAYNKSPVGLPTRLRLPLDGNPVIDVGAQAGQVMQAAAAEAIQAARR